MSENGESPKQAVIELSDETKASGSVLQLRESSIPLTLRPKSKPDSFAEDNLVAKENKESKAGIAKEVKDLHDARNKLDNHFYETPANSDQWFRIIFGITEKGLEELEPIAKTMQARRMDFDGGCFELKKAVLLGFKALIDVEELDICIKMDLQPLPEVPSKEGCAREFHLYRDCLVDMVSILKKAVDEMATKCSVASLVLGDGSAQSNMEDDREGTYQETKEKSEVKDVAEEHCA